MLGNPVGYMDVTESSRAKLRCPVEYMNVTVTLQHHAGTPDRPWILP
jgi:hypothetical protein